jgi:hypothetical protein
MSKTGATFLNDVAVFDDRTRLVSASDKGRVFRVDVANKRFEDLGVDVPSVNGLIADTAAKKVYTAAFGGPAGVIDLGGTPTYAALTKETGSLDGIAAVGGRRLRRDGRAEDGPRARCWQGLAAEAGDEDAHGVARRREDARAR